jgi:acyl-coenzyme A synthetase/AMP-(fatty) acid ligase
VGEKELMDFCRQRLADFKVPRHIHLVDEIPKTATGKVQRRSIAASFESP